MGVELKIRPNVSDGALNELFAAAWQNYNVKKDIVARLEQHSLSYVCAFDTMNLVGFVNLAWDGGVHGFIVDTSVHRDYRRPTSAGLINLGKG